MSTLTEAIILSVAMFIVCYLLSFSCGMKHKLPGALTGALFAFALTIVSGGWG